MEDGCTSALGRMWGGGEDVEGSEGRKQEDRRGKEAGVQAWKGSRSAGVERKQE